MSKIIVRTQLITNNEKMAFEGKGIFDQEQNCLKFMDQNAKITILLTDAILIRETEEAIISYKFSLEGLNRFEIFIKNMNQRGTLSLQTLSLEIKENYFDVIYQLDGNEFTHHYTVDWRII